MLIIVPGLKNVNSQRGSGAIQAFEIVPFSIIVNNQQVLQEPTGPPVRTSPNFTMSMLTHFYTNYTA